MKTDFKLREGTRFERKPNKPIISINDGGSRNTYLWVGNDAPDDKMCYATLSGSKKLETFAVNILKALKSKKLKP